MKNFTLAQKIINAHIQEGKEEIGEEIALKIDQTLTQDATGTMAYLQFEAIGIDRVKTELSVSYVDHNLLQSDFKNADDHLFLQSIAQKYGLYFSRPGNGICHQVHLERFAKPGKTLIGSDSHTPTAGGIGSLAMGAGGLDIAQAMAGGFFSIKYPKILGIKLINQLSDWVSAKDVILEVLRILDVKGGVGYILEYFGDGVKTLSVPDRATITNMGTETGCTTSIFPSDENTQKFLEAQGRGKDFIELKADDNAQYDEILEIDLSKIEPMAACPHSPGKVKKIAELAGKKINQVGIGSCTNSSLRDMEITADILKNQTIAQNVHLIINPGSRQVISHLIENKKFAHIVNSGARILENACGACIGMGAAPSSKAVSLRTYNRNFFGRSGTKDAEVYLVSPETAAVSAIKGEISDPRTFEANYPKFRMPQNFMVNDNMIIPPLDEKDAKNVSIIKGPNIASLPQFSPLENVLKGNVLLKLSDNITTDDIMPAGAKILPFRSNIPEISKFVFENIDKDFYDRAKKLNGGFILAGENYGQGSSREHAALAPKYLQVKAIIAKSFARIHSANLINFGILPLVLKNADDYDKISLNDNLELDISSLLEDNFLNFLKFRPIIFEIYFLNLRLS